MNVGRSQVTKALFDLVSSVRPPKEGAWASAEIGYRPYQTTLEMPYLGMYADEQKPYMNQALGVYRWDISYFVQIYLGYSVGDENWAIDVESFIDDIEALFLTPDLSPQTLGGLVVSAELSSEGIKIAPPMVFSGTASPVAIQIPIVVRTGI